MTATLAAMFTEAGKLCQDTTVAQVFPELIAKMGKQYQKVTVEHLRPYRGGVPSSPPSIQDYAIVVAMLEKPG